MPTVAVIRFPGSDAFVADPLVLKDALNILVKADGVISTYYGIQTEDGRSGYLVVIWETYEHHMNFKQHVSYPGLLTAVSLARSGPLDIQHVDFDRDAVLSFDVPATELVFMTPKAGVSLDDFHDKLATLREHLIKDTTCHAIAVGASRENKGTWLMVLGWDSVQAHVDAVSEGIFPELVKNLFAVADIDLKHTNLVKYAA
ncbi:hypothetical protein D9615_002902 [Tricholomella constricta]|uniref:ABM domain-containing protein n=1 Tax=Tricholomella constricta TaxID=117010 RepID=A0A8H5HFX8_9AGAR|nr:hypothetical protein D9615_002902 [Tricholomella constricta]